MLELGDLTVTRNYLPLYVGEPQPVICNCDPDAVVAVGSQRRHNLLQPVPYVGRRQCPRNSPSPRG